MTESNAMGTPVVAYDVNGLKDSVVDGTNGILDGRKLLNLLQDTP